MLAACAVFMCLTVWLYSVLSDNGSWLPFSFLLSLSYLFPFSFMFDTFLAVWWFLPPSHFLSKSHPTDANSLNRFPREHLWTTNGFLARLLSISQVLLSFSLSALSFFLCVGLFLFSTSLFHPACSVKGDCFFVKHCSHVLHSFLTHAHLFHHASSLFSLLCVFWHWCCFLG